MVVLLPCMGFRVICHSRQVSASTTLLLWCCKGDRAAYLAGGVTSLCQGLCEGIQQMAPLSAGGVKHAQVTVIEAEAWVRHCHAQLPQADHDQGIAACSRGGKDVWRLQHDAL